MSFFFVIFSFFIIYRAIACLKLFSFEVEGNEEFKKKRQGAVGENKLIGFISNGFENDNNSYLINGVNFDIRSGAININDSTKLETQIDHIFVCSKRIFIIETKHWKIECTILIF